MTDQPQPEKKIEEMTDAERCEAFKAEFVLLSQKWGCNFDLQFKMPQLLFEPSGLPQMNIGLIYNARTIPGWTPPKPPPIEQKVQIAEAPTSPTKEPAAK